MRIQTLSAALLIAMAFTTIASAQQPPNQQRRLGILGGLAGAAIGAAAGEDDGDAVPGALIGGTIGLITGSTIGNSMDRHDYQQQQYNAAIAQQQARTVTMSDVVSMTHAGLSDAVIISHIQTHGVAHHVSASDLIVLKQQGVSDNVLSAMQSVYQPRPVTVVRQPPPVVVREHYYTHPSPAWWHNHHYYHHHGHRHGRYGQSSVRFRYGH